MNCRYISIRIIIIMLMLFLFYGNGTIYAQNNYDFEGCGTKEDPYKITSCDDLNLLRELVNTGESFEGKFFQQTSNIELVEEWIPIGVFDNGNLYTFKGIYDGNGYYIDGLKNPDEYTEQYAFFWDLGGVIANLGLVNIDIHADESAAFAIYSDALENGKVAIVNCYSTGNIFGHRNAGIARSLDKGAIVNTASTVVFDESDVMGILYYATDTKLYHCLSTYDNLAPSDIRLYGSKSVSCEELSDRSMWKNSPFFSLSQLLYGNHYNVELKEWCVTSNEGNFAPVPSEKVSTVSQLIYFTNNYFLIIILFILTLYLVFKKGKISKAATSGGTVILGLLVYFLDFAMFFLKNINLTHEKVVFLCWLNILFCWFLYKFIRNIESVSLKKIVPRQLGILMIIVAILGFTQFDVVPRYDGSLYYGSFVDGCSWFTGDIISFLGAFVCWRSIYGIVLLLAPLEFIFPGEMTGIYIGTLLIIEITIVVVYKIIKKLEPQFDDKTVSVLCAIMVFSPYQFGLLTHFTMDNYLSYFVFWLIYSYLLDNPYMVMLCGLIMIFTKESAVIYYVIFLVVASIFELLLKFKGTAYDKMCQWWNTKKVVLWVMPGIMYLVKNKVINYLIIQNFYGANASGDGKKTIIAYANDIAQCFIWNFRWFFTISVIVMIVIVISSKKRLTELLSKEEIIIGFGVLASGLAYALVLLLYNGDTQLARYTSILSASFFILFVICVKILTHNIAIVERILMLVLIMLVAQTFITVDPSIILTRNHIETGGNPVYKLSFSDEKISLGGCYGRGYKCLGDTYAYNLQYTLYNSLINEMLEDIKPTKKTKFYILDVYPYEMHLDGSMQYNIFWNIEKEKLSYKAKNSNYIKLNTKGVISESLDEEYLDDNFYLIVPYRVDEAKAITTLAEKEYTVESIKNYHCINGAMRIYHIVKI